ncbi:permease of the major facilitator superfamily protein [Levilactobacillus koreensis JCM 16448]|uniref:Major facilitator transporter n=1 Tax=Levilactobacillus koreensis TaxID=637971 RepID=A0AAC8ZG68_9LACO|nr:MFS transporter [Levilactobacillus koreensis]AKP64245.1 major facilitator transporter [Levilactobacillus koreensis]KRK92320.1 permease of the major facilitator superfamily protein [Levilactobacillus koreensis JCM 16448]
MENAKSKITMSKSSKIRFSASFFIFALLWMGGLGIVSAVLLPQHLKDLVGPNASTAIFGVLNAATAIASLVANLLFGNLSDRTRSRFGRRTPWVVAGGIVGGLSLFLIGVLDNAWAIGISYCISMVGLNMMIAPVIATLSDRVSDDMRATMSAFMSAGTTCGTSVGTLIGARFISIQIPGFIIAGVLMGIAGICTVIVWPHEESAKDLPAVEGGFAELLASFRPPLKGARDFWLAFLGRTLLIFSYYMILNYQLYILESYIGQGKTDAAATISIMSVVTMIVGLVGSLASGAISDAIGRRKLPVIVSAVLLAIGYLLPWVMRSPFSMILFAGFAGLGYAVYGAVDQALNIDVLPNKEEAGKDLGILNIATTLGQTVGPIVTSIVVVMGGYKLVFPIAIVFVLLACIFIQMIRSTK